MKPEESLDIISRMVSDTRRSVLQQAYIPFLIWGITTVVVSLLVYFLVRFTDDYRCFYCWYLILLVGLPLVKIFSPRTKLVRTGISLSLRSIWLMMSVLLICFSVSSFFVEFNILFFISLLLSMGSYISGAIISYPFLMYSSLPGFLAAALMLVISGLNQIPLFAAAIAVMMIVPGFKMKQDLKNLN